MLKRVAIIGLVLLLSLVACSFFIPNTWDEDLAGYTVEPATDADFANSEPLEMVEIGFWDLPPRIMLMHVLNSISPHLLFPLEVLIFFKMFTLLGFRMIAHKNVLNNLSRRRIYDFIVANPGVDFTEISQKTGIRPGTLRYHLAILLFMNKVETLSTTRNARYYENSGRYPLMEQCVLKYIHNEPSRNILLHLLKNPEITRGELEERLGISGAGVNWHLRRFSDEGILSIAKEGRTARYTFNPDVLPYLEKYLRDYGGVAMPAEPVMA